MTIETKEDKAEEKTSEWKQWSVRLIITILLTATITTLINIAVNRFFIDKPQLVYTLNSLEIGQTTYHQITVRNNGKKEATEIKVGISAKADDKELYISRHYGSDAVDQYEVNNKTQWIYSRLLPNGEFSITFKSPAPVSDEIIIEYNGKQAKNALNNEAESTFGLSVGIAGVVVAIASFITTLVYKQKIDKLSVIEKLALKHYY